MISTCRKTIDSELEGIDFLLVKMEVAGQNDGPVVHV